MKRLFGLVLTGLVFLGVFSAPVRADDTVKVWTQNLYLGADLAPVIEAAMEGTAFDPAAELALQQMGANLFPLRAQRLATEIALNEPDLIALQEVENITLNGANDRPPFVDYLKTLLDALALRGQHYELVATVKNLDLEVEVAPYGTVHVVDRDVILAREGVTANPLSLCFDKSVDGCTYSTIIKLTPLPPPAPLEIDIKRGYVGVKALVRGKSVLFVNTHLEERELVPGDTQAAGIQSAQAAELVGVLDNLPTEYQGIPHILLGDFNSSPRDAQIDSIPTPYQIIISDLGKGNGFTDAWTKNLLALLDPKGYTCCQEADLANKTSLLDQRIDLIFVRNQRFQPWAFVTTRVPLLPLSLPPNWASDHGGVFAKLVFK